MSNNAIMTSSERRIANELHLLYNRFGNVTIHREENENSVVHVKYNGDHYSIEFNSSYPFKPPKNIRVNFEDVKNMCILDKGIFLPYLIECYGAHCMICGSILFNPSLWTPGLKIGNIIDEICNIVLVKKKILMRILCDAIRLKHGCLMEYACFEDYLFPRLLSKF